MATPTCFAIVSYLSTFDRVDRRDAICVDNYFVEFNWLCESDGDCEIHRVRRAVGFCTFSALFWAKASDTDEVLRLQVGTSMPL